MKKVLYDLTGLPGFDVVLEPLQRIYPFSVDSSEHLAKQDIGSLTGQIVLLSDERFDKETDEDIVRYLERLTQTGLKLIYVGVPRNTSYFDGKLYELGVNAYLVAELTEEGVQHWLATVLEPWVRATEEATTIPLQPLPRSQERPSAPSYVKSGTPTPSLCIVVSGAPGAGTTFVGLNLATWLAEQGDVQYVEGGFVRVSLRGLAQRGRKRRQHSRTLCIRLWKSEGWPCIRETRLVTKWFHFANSPKPFKRGPTLRFWTWHSKIIWRPWTMPLHRAPCVFW